MYHDKESEIIEHAYRCTPSKILEFNGNSFNKKIRRAFFDEVNLVDNSAKDALPPDYYSDVGNIMFDVFRLDDSEQKKSYNPVKMREREREQEILGKFGDIFPKDIKLFINSQTSEYDKEHTYIAYRKEFLRVFNKHIKKIDIWKTEHPDIRYKGIFICDETELYFNGIIIKDCEMPDNLCYFGIPTDGLIFHRPWLDKDMMKPVYDSEIDFVIWFMPYKSYSLIEHIKYNYPQFVIVDTRYPFDNYDIYDYTKFMCL